MTFALYHHDVSTCGRKMRICLAEKSIPWLSRIANIAQYGNLTPEYLAINPNSIVVPSLVHVRYARMRARPADAGAVCEGSRPDLAAFGKGAGVDDGCETPPRRAPSEDMT